MLKEVKIKSAHDIGDPTLIAKQVVEEEQTTEGDSGLNAEQNDSTMIDYDLIKSKLKRTVADDENKQTKRIEDVDEKKLKA